MIQTVIVKAINSVCARARKAKVPVILVQHEEKGPSLERDTKGWQLAKELAIDEEDLHTYKQVGDSFHGTNLEKVLKGKQVRELFICGLQTDYCVNASTRR